MRTFLRLFGISLLAGSVVLAAPKGKLTAEDIVAMHLESLGTTEARSRITTRIAQGSVRMLIKANGVGEATGRAYLFGAATRFRGALPFYYSFYRGEQPLLDGGEAPG